MRTYKSIYSFDVIENIGQGKQVRILDREREKVYEPEELNVVQLVNFINSKEKNQYEFWIVEDVEDEDE